ncbi:MAG: hypothetical protein ACTSWK_04155 [Promethearchaeota archaeon]
MLCCNVCIINPICQIGCDKLLKDLDKITLEDFTKYINLSKRLMSLSPYKKITLNLECGIKVDIYLDICKFTKKLYREYGPSIEFADEDKYWHLNGELHREDGPAVEFVNGTKDWYLNGKRHREDGPAVEFADGTKEWYLNGKRHREDGPAVEYNNGDKKWYLNGILKKIKRESKND